MLEQKKNKEQQRPTVMFIDDDDQLLNVLTMRAEQAGFNAVSAHNLLTAMSLFSDAKPDLVCVDVNLPSGNGLNMCELIQSELQERGVPLIVLSGQTDEQTMNTCRQLGAKFIKKSPDVWPTLQDVISELVGLDKQEHRESQVALPKDDTPSASGTGQADIAEAVFAMLGADGDLSGDISFEMGSAPDHSHSIESEDLAKSPYAEVRDHRPWVLLIEDDHDVSLALKLRLEKSGIAVARAFEGLEGVKEAFSRPAEAIILDFNLPNGQGDYVLRRLKSNPLTRDIPVIVVTGVRDQNLEQKMLSLGACRFLTKPIDFECLNEELQKHIALQPV